MPYRYMSCLCSLQKQGPSQFPVGRGLSPEGGIRGRERRRCPTSGPARWEREHIPNLGRHYTARAVTAATGPVYPLIA